MKDTVFCQKKTLNIHGKLLQVDRPLIMGVLNITPDSFYEGSRVRIMDDLVRRCAAMIAEGADILDIGGYSSRPGAAEVTEAEELERVIPAVTEVHQSFREAILSIDTFRAKVAMEAIKTGASMINDISGGQADEKMFKVVAECRVPYILMHMQGTPATMRGMTDYKDLIGEIAVYFNKGIAALRANLATDILLDPGIGFAKTIQQNFEILKNLPYFKIFGLPLVIGVSRKSLIYKTLQIEPDDALNGTTVLNTISVLNQASILRVHDVKAAKEVIRLTNLYLS